MLPPIALADLARSGITQAIADKAGLFYVDNAAEIYPEFDPEPAIVLPYWQADLNTIATYWLDGAEHNFCRVRYLNPKRKGSGFTQSKAQRYGQPRGSGSHVYFPPGVAWDRILLDVQEPLIITEGEKKALAGAAAGFPVMALGGVWNFTEGYGGEVLMRALASARWANREVYICFDSDALKNSGILTAEARLIEMLMRDRGARVFIVRLPPDGDNKVGLDDYILKNGADAFAALLGATEPLGALDAKVISLNSTCAWIADVGMIWDRQAGMFIDKDDFVTGSDYSHDFHTTMGAGQRAAAKRISVAKTWLTHPHAARFDAMLFRPGMGDVVTNSKGRPCLNSWVDFEYETGVTASDPRIVKFMQLTTFMFQNMQPEDRELPFKMMAFKAQNPMHKIGLCLVLIGDQGSGKTLWGECIGKAFSPYNYALESKAFGAHFQPWMEKTLFALVNEASPEHMQVYGDQLKALITDVDRTMDVKFINEKQVKSFAVYMLTANKRAVGSFSYDDRRMVVIACPKPDYGAEMQELYRYLGDQGEWASSGGAKALLGYLLEYDLKGWRPPAKAPESREKFVAYAEGLSAVQQVARDMLTSDENSVVTWLRASEKWCAAALRGNNPAQAKAAADTMDALGHWTIRPWYEPRELALMFPYVMETLIGSKHDRTAPIGRISCELRDAGIRYLECSDSVEGFMWQGRRCSFLVVSEFEEWSVPITQAEFERHMASFPKYSERRNNEHATRR